MRKKESVQAVVSGNDVQELTAEIRRLTNELSSVKQRLEDATQSLQACHERLESLECKVTSNENLIKQLKDTHMREAISPEDKLLITLRFLATGDSYTSLQYMFKVSKQSISRFVPVVCEAIIQALKDYIKLPSSIEEWQEIARGYESRWHFPNCGGAIDGKHIRIRKPANSGSYYYNYKHYFSIVLMAIVNADYEFLYVDIGCNGRVSDGGVIEYTSFYNKLQNEQLNLPPNNMNKNNMNFVFVADDAFALHENVIKPYPQRNLTREERIFNYRLCRARRTVENAFGILSSRFRVLHTEINMKPEKIDYIVLALCCLHNLLKKKERAGYLPTQALVTEDLDFGRVVHGDLSEVNPLTSLQQGHSRNLTILTFGS
ncbi:protein ANTAGONIST OF LIKE HETEROCHROMATIN PROTEIN 1-like [Aricia agestis]|uniref:protein ANTAGONIST OF LIKE HETEROCHROMATIN PROTEIN 1-like n=1 Tax=Aricia agestis TaxID=91739 RepID=UPI001C202545|nr:protein ANTAGONIST OF LIKE HETEROCHROMATIN PROTEIN 1-like [Aricia agestis]